MSIETYTEPVSQLLTVGDYRKIARASEPNYIEQFGLTNQDIPELIRMAVDTELNNVDSDRSEVWAPVHAWHALGQLQAEAAIAPLIGLFTSDDESVHEDMPDILGQIGGAAIPALASYLADGGEDVWALTLAADCLREIATHHPEQREAAIAPLLQQLEQAADNDPLLNSTLIHNLTLLKVVEAAPLIEQAFTTGGIDELLTGSWGRVQVDLGLKQESDFAPEALKPKIPPQLLAFRQNMDRLANAFQVQQRHQTKPAGFGTAPAPETKKTKKKKKT